MTMNGGKRRPDEGATVAGNAEFRSRAHDARQSVEHLAGHEMAFAVFPFWPGIRKQQKDPAYGRIRKCAEQQPSVIVENADVAKIVSFNSRKQLGDAINIGFAADKANIGLVGSLPGQVLPGAKSDFEPDIACAPRKQIPEIM